MDEETIFTKRFVDGIQKSHEERTDSETEYLCHVLKKLSEFLTFDTQALRNLLQFVSYQTVPENSVLYSPGETAYCWYYIVSGCVMISNMYFYSAGCSFGQCVDTNLRTDKCLVLEDTSLLKINYNEKELDRFVRRASTCISGSSLTNSMELSLVRAITNEEQDHTLLLVQRDEPISLSDGELMKDSEKTTPLKDNESSHDVGWCLNSSKRAQSYDSDHFKFDESAIRTLSASNDSLNRAVEDDPIRLGDEDDDEHLSREGKVKLRDKRKVAHRRSAPPTHNRSLRDSVGSLDYLSESQVDIDSDDEESVQSETSSMDSVYEVLSKPSSERTNEDIERVMDVLQYMPAFSNMTSNIREAIFHVLLLTTIPEEGHVLINNGDEVDKWYVVLHGQLRLIRDSNPDKILHIGESFGVSVSLKVLPHRGRLVTATKDCQVCYVSAEDYGRVLAQGEENLKRIEENEKIVTVLEKRAVSAKREGYFVIQATPIKLLDYLLEEGVDDFFHSDFLLTYRSFLISSQPIVDKITNVWSSSSSRQKERIIMIVLNWVSDHFSDFDCVDKMLLFLDWFERVLLEDGKIGEKRILDEARIRNAKIRSINLDRDGVNAPLEFSVVGGWELSHPVFISEVTPGSKPDTSGLRKGDQILTINDTKCDQRELREVLNILQKNYKLTVTVKSNIPKFNMFMSDPPQPPIEHRTITQNLPSTGYHPILRSNSTSVTMSSTTALPTKLSLAKDSPKHKRKGPGFLPIVKTLSKSSMEKFKSRLRNQNTTSSLDSVGSESPSGPLKARKRLRTRKSSQENLLDDSSSNGVVVRPATSAEDLHLITSDRSPKLSSRTNRLSKTQVVDSVVKIYIPDHTHKYLDVTPTTSVAEVISRGVKEFYPDRFVASPSDEFCVCMVTVQSRSGPIRNSVLPGHLTDLANVIGLESRYYLKERAYHGTLVQDEEAERIVKESRQWESILNLKPMQVAEELTRMDSEVFCNIDPSEFIADLWKDPNVTSRLHLNEFETIPNDEMYWAITIIVTETNSAIRAKIIKHFIKIAKCCKVLKNYNTMFHILSGLNHGLVQRLRNSWEKVPHKHKKTMEDLTSYMNPFHNMSKYRELQRSAKPPLIPFFPIVKKDLTFLYDGNDSVVDGLINFEKLRMLSRQIRIVKSYCSQTILPAPTEVDLSQLGVFNRTISSLHGSLRWKQRSPAHMMSLTESALKRVYNHNRMAKMVRKHLSRKYVLQDENYLEQIIDSHEKLMMTRRGNPPSPLNKGKKSVIEKKHRSANISPSNSFDATSLDVLTLPTHSITSNSLSAVLSPIHTDECHTPKRSPSVNSLTSTNSAPPK